MKNFSYLILLVCLSFPLMGFSSKNNDDVSVYRIPKEAPQQAPQQRLAAAAKGSQNGFSWVLPEGWQEDPAPGAMQLVSITAGESKASIVILGGTAGGIVNNVNRWRGQVGLPPASAENILADKKVLEGKAGRFEWYEINGEDNSILAAILQTETQSTFIKLIGPTDSVSANKEKFLSFTASFERAG